MSNQKLVTHHWESPEYYRREAEKQRQLAELYAQQLNAPFRWMRKNLQAAYTVLKDSKTTTQQTRDA